MQSINIYIHVYIYIYMYIPIHVRIHTHLQTHYTCAHIYTYTGDEMPHRSGEAETNAHGIGLFVSCSTYINRSLQVYFHIHRSVYTYLETFTYTYNTNLEKIGLSISIQKHVISENSDSSTPVHAIVAWMSLLSVLFHVYLSIRVHKPVCVDIYMYMYMYTYMYICVYIHIYMFIYIYICVYMYIHVYIYIYINTCI